jgi:hypothetical protein
VTSIRDRLPIQGKISCSRRIKIRSPCPLVHFGVNLTCHSRAIASKLFSLANLFERFIEFFKIPGSILYAFICFLAFSRSVRASANETSGKEPNETFSQFLQNDI